MNNAVTYPINCFMSGEIPHVARLNRRWPGFYQRSESTHGYRNHVGITVGATQVRTEELQ